MIGEVLRKSQILENIHLEIAIQGMPRILSLMDREEFRPTYGSFDRNYWQYKMIDFSGSLFQTATLSLALAYKYPFEGNPYYNNKKMLKLCEGAIDYLPKIQNKDGSFSHNYPYIFSVATVCFPIYTATEAHLLLQKDSEYRINEDFFFDSLKKSAKWLMRQFDYNVINQETGSLMALYNIFLITKDQNYLKAIQKKLQNILKYQSTEGWFNEYGGCDIGYSTLTVDYLAKYYAKTKDSSVLEPLGKLLHFLHHFIHLSGTLGGEYASRNNEFVIPSGFECLSNIFPESREIANCIIKNLANSSMMNPNNMDDVYFCMNHHSFFQAAHYFEHFRNNFRLNLPKNTSIKQPYSNYFTDAQIFLLSNQNFSIIVGCGKGGVLRVFKNEKPCPKLLLTDCGYVGKTMNDKIISNQWLDRNNNIQYNEEGKELTIYSVFHKLSFNTTSSLKILISRLALPLLKKTSYFRKKLYKYLRKKMIYNAPPVPLELKRKIEFKDNTINLTDKITVRKGFCVKSLINIPKFTTIYGQSKNFFQKQELDYLDFEKSEDICNTLKTNRSVYVRKTLDLRNERLSVEYS